MPRHLYRAPGNHDFVPASATRAPLRALSCTYSSRDLPEPPEVHRSFRSFGPIERGARSRCSTKAADPRGWCDALSTDYWNPPTSESQHARQRILTVIVAFVLAAILAQAGW
jgi:hypothetical protein